VANLAAEIRRIVQRVLMRGVAGAISILVLTACYRQDMADQPRYDPFEESTFFADGLSARRAPEGTVARTTSTETTQFLTGRSGEQLLATMPIAIDMDLLRRGRERYDIFCSPCHDRTGSGNGMAVIRGFQRLPPSFHMERLREAPDGHFFDVITRGFGAMQSYASEIAPRDRWAIVAYVRALQLSRNARMTDVPAEERNRAEEWDP
jgi:mono/diheme cytochrome c family protein